MHRRTKPLVPLDLKIERKLRKLKKEFREQEPSEVVGEEERRSTKSSSLEIGLNLQIPLEIYNMAEINPKWHNGQGDNEISNNVEDNRSVREINHSQVNYGPYSFYTDEVNFEIKGALIVALPVNFKIKGA